MISNIDPRVMQQMLQLQLYEGQSLTVGGTGSTGLFDYLLHNAQERTFTDVTQDAAVHSLPAMKKATALHPALSQAITYEPLIEQASMRFGVESSLIKAVIQAESSFNPLAQSPAGAKGLMQLMDNTARSLGVTDSFDPQQNINGGTRYLAQLLERFDGSIPVALAAYNAGPGRISRLGITDELGLQQQFMQLPQETRNYVAKVLEFKQALSI
ncbi:lytic transglycosylase domain-containing protein [Paenibacillus senegalensis]|uniref:lytic transglycosylase domain-containing protein n=1 Tax=Paenibacillus senegalensis TaxID=1465766 RepID=UPI000287F8EE|nr:lytic transglycosylase domain-containing protein [Paenibacillus senegalensis]